MKKRGRKLLGLLLCAAMTAGLLPGSMSVTKAESIIGKIRVGDSGDVTTTGEITGTGGTGTATVSIEDNKLVLTLDNFSYTGAGWTHGNVSSPIEYYDNNQSVPLTIRLIGNNSVRVTASQGTQGWGIEASYLTITGPGSLSVSAGYYGIFCNPLTINDGAKVTAEGTEVGVNVMSLNITGGSSLKASGGSSAIYTQGNITISEGSRLTATGGNKGINANNHTITIVGEGNSVTIASGSANGRATDATIIHNDTPGAGYDSYDKVWVSFPKGSQRLSDSISRVFFPAAITFYANNGTSETHIQEPAFGSVTLDANSFTNTGSEFVGWNTTADGKGKSYEDQAAVTVTEPMELYAQWKKPNPAAITGTAEVVSGGNTIGLASNITGVPADYTGTAAYAIGTDSTAGGCTVDSGTGVFTSGTKTGTCTVKVTLPEDDTYAPKTGTITVTVIPGAPGAPTAENVTSTSVTLKKTDGYQYSMDGTTWQDSNVFSGLNRDTEYTFYQRIAGDANHEPSPASAGTKIRTGSAVYSVIEGGDEEYTKESGKNVTYKIVRTPDNELALQKYSSTAVDGKTVSEDYLKEESGSLILTVKSAYLDTLSEGEHKVKVSFTDGSAETTLKIKAAPAPSEEPTPSPTLAPTPTPTPGPTATPKPKPVPKTGDSADLALWLGLILLGLLGIGGFAVMKSRK